MHFYYVKKLVLWRSRLTK